MKKIEKTLLITFILLLFYFTKDINMLSLTISFSMYLDNIRFSYAKNLLCFTDYPILEIAQTSGFADYTNFVRRFKKINGLTPTEFRKTPTRAKTEKIN